MKNKEVLDNFLLQKKGKSNELYTDGNIIMYRNICIAQWKKSSILLNHTSYNYDIDSMIDYIKEIIKSSMLLFRFTSKAVPENSKSILQYE